LEVSVQLNIEASAATTTKGQIEHVTIPALEFTLQTQTSPDDNFPF
jgi:hypothetical protein